MASEVRVGSEFAGYRIESEIGRGGMSVVYLAEHLRLKRRVALKLISSDLATQQGFRDRFIRESQLAASLEHPNIVPIHDAGEADGVLYIAMRFVQGIDLKGLVRSEGPLQPTRAVAIVAQAAAALDAAHAEGLVHRDVKPGNILLAANDHVYLSDFGLTKRTTSDSGLTATGQFVGTLDYAAPEQFEGKPLDARTDVYSLGCVLYECLTGRLPFEATNEAALVYAHLLKPPPRPSEVSPELPQALDEVVAKAMAKAPDERYATAGALAGAATMATGVEAAGALARQGSDRDEAGREPPAGPRGRPESWLRSRVGVMSIAAVVVVAAVAIAAIVVGANRSGPASPPAGPQAKSTNNTVWRLDTSTGRLVATIPAGDSPGAVAIGEGSVWVADRQGSTVSRIDPVTNRAVSISVGKAPSGIALAQGYAWVINSNDQTLQRIDPSTNKAGAAVSLKARPLGIVAAEGSLWVFDLEGVEQVDPTTGHIVKRIPLSGIGPHNVAVDAAGPDGPIAASGGAAWVVWFTHLYRVDLTTGTFRDVAPTTMQFCDVGASEEAVWLLGCTEGPGAGLAGGGPARLFRLDPGTGRADPPVPVDNGGAWLSVGSNVVWILSANGSLSRFDARDDTVRPFGKAGRSLGGFAVGAGAVWVSVDVG